MKFLRRISTRQLLSLCAVVAALGLGATGLALATTGGGPTPAPKPLPVAIHDALAAPQVAGVSGRIEFTNHLIDSSSIQGSDPLISGASGRFWASPDGHLRIELQADASNRGGGGDVQIVADRSQVTVFDSGAGTAYEATLPQHNEAGSNGGSAEQVPSVDRIQRQIDKVMEHADLSGATPSDVAGQPAYTVRVSPKHDGGLLGGAEVAWDAVHGTPLRAAVFASDSSSPVLELKVTDISFAAVPDSVFAIAPPAGTKITQLSPPNHGSDGQADSAPVTGLDAVQQQTSFQIGAPQSLAGLPQGEVRLISSGKDAGALVTYGEGLGGIAVVELPADSGNSSNGSSAESGRLKLPSVSVNGATGQELDTALGTVIRFQRGGVEYIVAGSVLPAAAEAAARAL